MSRAERRAIRNIVPIRDFDGRGFHCLCAGDLGIELLVADTRIALLGMHQRALHRLP